MSEESEYETSVKSYKGEVEAEVEAEADEEEDEEEEEEGETEDREMLFLIEFLVDTLCINMKNLNIKNIDPCILDGQTCVVLTFLNFPPMSICEKDWGPENDDNTDEMIKFNAGKSLMFALSESQFSDPPPIYLDVSAHKMMPHGSPDPKLPIGKTKICLSELFKQIFEKVQKNPNKLPVSKSIKDSYPLTGHNAKKSPGEIIIYIRLSCLGQNVVTEFQRGYECEPFLFKNRESNKVYECKAKDDVSDDNGPVCPPCPGKGDYKMKPFFGSPTRPSCYDQVDQDDEEFDEFGTEVHGHALTIKIQKSRKTASKAQSDQCGCNGCSRTKEGGGPGNQISFGIPQNQSFCKGGSRVKVHPISGCDQMQEPLRITAGPDDGDDKDIFVLRIGKKGEVNGKGKMELELRTPKQKKDIVPEGPKKVNKETQTDREDGGGKKGKGKKKKK